MPNIRVSLLEGRPLLDIASYARGGPGRRDGLSPDEIALISRTVRRVPEVMVKVLSRNSTDAASVDRHLDYIGRKGGLELETDDGETVSGKAATRDLLEDWDLDLEERRRGSELSAAAGRKPAKLVHKLMLSMPPGTPAQGVKEAARNFLREEFGLQHRYAFVLHTDEPHPHVHAVVKAVSEQGERLDVRKATLRYWRQEFARHLREQGIEANATERAVRGQTRKALKDGIYRTSRRNCSTHLRERIAGGTSAYCTALSSESERKALMLTRQKVRSGWEAISALMGRSASETLARKVQNFSNTMEPPNAEIEQMR